MSQESVTYLASDWVVVSGSCPASDAAAAAVAVEGSANYHSTAAEVVGAAFGRKCH